MFSCTPDLGCTQIGVLWCLCSGRHRHPQRTGEGILSDPYGTRETSSELTRIDRLHGTYYERLGTQARPTTTLLSDSPYRRPSRRSQNSVVFKPFYTLFSIVARRGTGNNTPTQCQSTAAFHRSSLLPSHSRPRSLRAREDLALSIFPFLNDIHKCTESKVIVFTKIR